MDRKTLLADLKRRDQERRARIPEVSSASEHVVSTRGFDFSELPAHKQLRMMRAAAEFAGVASPFFQVHDGCAGATSIIQGREVVNFASYNYLGLNGHPEVTAAAKAAIDQYGTSASASRLVAGERPVHRELEACLAKFFGTESALAFVSGHATNVSVIGHLLGREDIVLCDAYSHNSIFEGIKLSGAARLVFPHNDLDALASLLRQHRSNHANALIVVEGLYSMDGDCPNLERLIEIKESSNSWLMIDEAHSTGVLGRAGRGIAEEQGVDPKLVEIWMGTLSKTLASTGGYVTGSQPLIDILRAGAPGFVYSVGLPPSLAAAALMAVRVLEREPERVHRLRENAALFLECAKKAELDTGTAINGSVIPVMVGDSMNAVLLSNRLLDRGYNVRPIIFPAVAHKQARVRFFVTCEHTAEQIEPAVAATAEVLGQLRKKAWTSQRS
jgi:8-amino-7-oxononanoate synthase